MEKGLIKKILYLTGSLRTRIVLMFFILLIAGGFATTSIGSWMVSSTILEQAQKKVTHDLRTAWMLYNKKLSEIKSGVSLIANRIRLDSCPFEGEKISKSLDANILLHAREGLGLDFLTLASCRGEVLFRTTGDGMSGGKMPPLEILRQSLSGRTESGTVVFDYSMLSAESKALADRARIQIIDEKNEGEYENEGKIEGKKKKSERWLDSGLVMISSAPVYDLNGKVAGVLYGGVLLNRNYEIVDKLRDTVYRGETFKKREIGTCTIFLGDIRISTNVMTGDGKRAIGTLLSHEITKTVLKEGKQWRGKAFVVTDWYLTAYDPLLDYSGKRVGIFYVGMLRAPYVAVRDRVILTFFLIAGLCLIFVFFGTHYLTKGIIGPLEKLAEATEKVSSGELEIDIKYEGKDEIGKLTRNFNRMVENLREMRKQWDRRLEDQLVQSEKLASLGKMAAGVAHELNSPLTGIMTFSYLLRDKCPQDGVQRDWLDTIVGETERCARIVRQMLDFAREFQPDIKPVNINDLVIQTLDLVRYQAIFHDIDLELNLSSDIQEVDVDPNLIKQALLNIVLNAVDAMEGKGRMEVKTSLRARGSGGRNQANKLDKNGQWVEISISDTGCGISPEIMKRIFDPFFTTKEVGKGTGLGLAVTYGIIKRHGGDILVKSTVGEGSTFTIILPLRMQNGK